MGGGEWWWTASRHICGRMPVLGCKKLQSRMPERPGFISFAKFCSGSLGNLAKLLTIYVCIHNLFLFTPRPVTNVGWGRVEATSWQGYTCQPYSAGFSAATTSAQRVHVNKFFCIIKSTLNWTVLCSHALQVDKNIYACSYLLIKNTGKC